MATPTVVRVFLDANVLFSAAVGGRSFELLWSLSANETCALFTSRHCLVEAKRNLERKRPDSIQGLGRILRPVTVVDDLLPDAQLERLDLPPPDTQAYATAVAVESHVFVTGDLKHFGPLMDRTDMPTRVMTVRAFLLRSPSPYDAPPES